MRPCMARHRLGRILIAVVLTAATCVAASADSDLEGPVLVPSFPSIGSRFEAETDTGYPSPETTEPAAPPENDVEDPSDDDAPPRADADDATATTADETGDSSTADADTPNNDAVAPETNGDAGESKSPAKELPTDADASAEDDSSSEAETAPAEPETPPKPRRELTPAMAQLRDRVRRTLGTHHGHLLGTDGNSVTEIIYACRAFGCDTNVREVNSLGKVLNGITCLCWNYPCAGFTPLLMADGHITGRIGYGCQEQPGQLIATLALARVQDSYPLRVGEDTRTVADLVEYEKLACRASIDKSLSMIGLMYYAGSDGEWENRLGEPWSIERVLREELDKPIIGAPFGGTQRLARAVGTRMATELITSGRNLDAAEALRIGLVNRVLPADELLPAAEASESPSWRTTSKDISPRARNSSRASRRKPAAARARTRCNRLSPDKVSRCSRRRAVQPCSGRPARASTWQA